MPGQNPFFGPFAYSAQVFIIRAMGEGVQRAIRSCGQRGKGVQPQNRGTNEQDRVCHCSMSVFFASRRSPKPVAAETAAAHDHATVAPAIRMHPGERAGRIARCINEGSSYHEGSFIERIRGPFEVRL